VNQSIGVCPGVKAILQTKNLEDQERKDVKTKIQGVGIYDTN
jgi:hypothetical protein